jgi:hypothetical protein
MNQEDELARRIARLLKESADKLPPERRQALTEARKAALARYAAQSAPVGAHAWAGRFSEMTERSVFGVRYLIPLAALVLGLMGVVYVQTSGVMNGTANAIADIDAGLLTDDLPIDAYLDQDFQSWLKRFSR